MNAKVLVCGLVCAGIVGCRANVEIDPVQQATQGPATGTRSGQNSAGKGNPPLSPPVQSSESSAPNRLSCDGLWVPGGWMGDAENPSGPLQRRVYREDFRSPPTCEQWIYTPTENNSPQRWSAVAYQYPPGGYNFGDKPGKDLSGQGFTHVTFWAKSSTGRPARLLIKSGGHTSPGSAYPASYSVDFGVVELDHRWQQVAIPISRLNHTNVTCAMAFVLLADEGSCEFLIDDLAFEAR